MDDSNGDEELRITVSSLVVAAVALIISLVALTISTAQVLQQYLATAVGYANCGSRVMGPWARYTKLVFRPWELRFEVTYQVPMLFLLRPSQKQGPIPDSEVHVINGTWGPARLLSRSPTLKSEHVNGSHISHIVASWLPLLFSLEHMECKARIWLSATYHQAVLDDETPPRMEDCAVYASFQNATQTLDMMPEGVKKPFALSTISDIVVIAAMLGANWKQFDRENDRYLAEGSGVMIFGSRVPHLGISFTFSTHARRRLDGAGYHLIPGAAVNEMCFGVVQATPDCEARPFPHWNASNQSTLRLSTPKEVATSLRSHGWDRATVDLLVRDGSTTEHLFPVMFEVVGMMATKSAVKQFAFGRLPNPTYHHWREGSSDSVLRLLRAFIGIVQEEDGANLPPSIYKKLRGLQDSRRFPSNLSTFFLEQTSEQSKQRVFLLALHSLLDKVDSHLQWEARSCKGLLIRLHFKAVLNLLNGGGTPATYTGKRDYHPGETFGSRGSENDLTASFSLDGGDQELDLMRTYFEVVRNDVLSEVDALQTGRVSRNSPGDSQSATPTNRIDRETASSVWMTLVLRMLLWLLLHFFDPEDVQIPKGDLMNSHLPVYIT